MSEVTAPIMTDATGQSIDGKLNSLLGKMDNLAAAFQPNASGIVYSNTTSGLTGDDVQEAIDEMAADVSEIKQSLSTLLFQGAGKVTNLNLPDRTKGVIYVNTYDAGATNAPNSSNGGYLFTFVNTDSANYGIQVSVTNGGIHARRLQGGNYQAWVVVVSV